MTAGIRKIGKFDVIEVLGRGGMGIVYKGMDPSIGRTVAIKMTLGYAHDPELLKRFYREAQSAGKLQHPNIVTIYDLGDQDGNPYMVMEYIEGESLESVINAGKPLSLERKLNIAIQLCDALSYAHQHNVIHRDIKPANVMVLKDFTVKIVDFGIARIGNESVTKPGQLMGSVPYMSPEQIKDDAYVDFRTDIFSAGVLLYQLLAYALPFNGKDMGAILLKIVHEPPPPLSAYLESYPPELDRILQTALAKNVEQRYPTTERFAFDLMRVQDQLKREKISGCLDVIEGLCASHQWEAAREQILQLLQIDRQHPRGNELLSVVEQQLLLQKRSEQAHQLRVRAEEALSRHDLGTALQHLDRAVELDCGNEALTTLRNSIAQEKKRADQIFTLLHRAESSRETGELETAQEAIDDALHLDPQNSEALGLKGLIARDLAEQNKQKQIQNYLEEARKRISARSFTGALELLKQAEAHSPDAPGVRELIKLALSGRDQEIRRKQLEGLNAEIQDDLNRDDFASACAKADAGLQTFPENRSLLTLKKLAEKQRQANEKRLFIEERIAAARQALDSPEPRLALEIVNEALIRYPKEPALLSMISIVNESLRRGEEEKRKAEAVQEAKEAIRNRHYQEAVEILQAARKQVALTDVDELDELAQFAQEEAASCAIKQKVEAAAEQASGLVSAGEYEKAIDFLQLTMADYDDDELHIILEDARRRLREFKELLGENISTGKRLLRQDRYADAIKFLEIQPEQCRKSQEFKELLESARRDFARIQRFSTTKEEVREALSKEAFALATAALEDFKKQFGETNEAVLLQTEIEAARLRTAALAMEKALSDVRVLLMVRSFDSAENILEEVSEWQPYAPAELQQQYNSVRSYVAKVKEQARARELQEKLDQARMSDQETVGANDGLAEGDVDATERMSISKLHTILGQVAQIEEHYLNNPKLMSAIGELRNRLTIRINQLESGTQTSRSNLTPLDSEQPLPLEEKQSTADLEAQQRAREQKILARVNELKENQDFQQALALLDSELSQSPQSTVLLEARESLLAAQRRSGRLSEAEDFRRAGNLTAALKLLKSGFGENDAQAAALLAKVEADQQARRQEVLAESLIEIRSLVAAGQLSQALEKLRQCLTQYPGQSEILALLRSTEEKLQAAELIAGIRDRAEALIDRGNYDKAIALATQNAGRGPEFKNLLASVRQKAEGKRLDEMLKGAMDLERSGRFKEALEIVRRASGLYGASPAVSELENSLQKQVEDQDRQQARDADLKALLKIEREFSQEKSSALHALLQKAQTIASSYPLDEDVTSVFVRIRAEIEPAALPTAGMSSASKRLAVDQVSQSKHAGVLLGDISGKYFEKYGYWRPAAVLGGCLLLLLITGIVLRGRAGAGRGRSTQAVQSGSSAANPVQAQEQAAIDDAGKLFAAGNLAAAKQELEAVAGLNGPLQGTIQQKLSAIEAAMKSESSQQAKDDRDFAEAEQEARGTDVAKLSHANDLLMEIISNGGPRKAEAQNLRILNTRNLQRLLETQDTQRQETIAVLRSQLEIQIQNGDFAAARHQLEAIRRLGADAVSLSAKIDQAEKSKQSHANEIVPGRTPAPLVTQGSPSSSLPGNDAPRTRAGGDQPPNATSGQANAPVPLSDEKDWATLKESEKPDQLLAFAAKYPKSQFADRAREKAQQLTDSSAIRTTLAQYKSAYENRSMSELDAIWTNIPKKDRKQLADSFKEARSIHMDIHETSAPVINGDSATVVLDRKLQFTFPEGMQKPENQITVHLRRKAAGWVIDGIS